MPAARRLAGGGEDIVRLAPIEVRIELEKASYRLGESFRFTVTTNQDCYFLVYTIDFNDQVEVHDPSVSEAYMGQPLLKAGERRAIPVPDAPGRAVTTPPAGFPRSVRFAVANSWRSSDYSKPWTIEGASQGWPTRLSDPHGRDGEPRRTRRSDAGYGFVRSEVLITLVHPRPSVLLLVQYAFVHSPPKCGLEFGGNLMLWVAAWPATSCKHVCSSAGVYACGFMSWFRSISRVAARG
jgi:hypothetical protein